MELFIGRVAQSDSPNLIESPREDCSDLPEVSVPHANRLLLSSGLHHFANSRSRLRQKQCSLASCKECAYSS